jgi:DNA-binding response OmpR family regulator
MAEVKDKTEQMMVPSPLTPARLLIVDDEPHIRSALSKALSLLGYMVDEAGGGSAALALLQETEYDLMVLDMRMPDMDGTEVMQQVRRFQPELLIIILTGHASLENAIAAIKSEAVDYLLKPVSTHEIAGAVQRALSKRSERLHQRRLVQVIGEALETLRPAETTPAVVDGREKNSPRFLRVRPLTLDYQKRLVIIEGQPDQTLPLTEGETSVLARLMARPDEVISCEELVRQAWDEDLKENEAQNVVRPHIFRLRRKLEALLSGVRLIHTLRRRGYFFSTKEVDLPVEKNF